MATLIGTVLKIAVSIEGLTTDVLDGTDIMCEFFVNRSESVTVSKNEMVHSLGTNVYVCVVDSTGMDAGSLMVKTTLQIPDEQVSGGKRRELYVTDTGVVLCKV